MNLYSAIDKALDRNIVVYDSDAKDGRFTARLFALLSTTGRRNADYKTKIKAIYISREDETHLSECLAINEDIFFRYNVQFVDIDISYYYKLMGGCKCCGKEKLMLAEFENGDYLLGIY